MVELYHILEEDGLALIRRTSPPWVTGIVRTCSQEEYSVLKTSLSPSSNYVLIRGLRVLVEAKDTADPIVKRMQPETMQKYLHPMADWYVKTVVMTNYREYKNLVTAWYYRLYYNKTVRILLLIIATLIVLALAAILTYWVVHMVMYLILLFIGFKAFYEK